MTDPASAGVAADAAANAAAGAAGPAAGAWPWIWLVCAGVLEVAWAVGLKYSQGLSRPVPSVVTIVLMILSFVCLAQAVKGLPLGTSYAVWTGIGTIGAAVLGMILFKEPATLVRIGCVAIILLGIVGLKLTARTGA